MSKTPNKNSAKQSSVSPAFTIVELLVVIVIIGILAAITIISYVGVRNKADVSSVVADLDNNAKVLKLYYSSYDSYPTALDSNNCPTAPTIDNQYCLKMSSNNTLVSYTSIVKSDFHLTIKNGNNQYSINSTTSPAVTTTPSDSTIGQACPTGFIPVPGSGTYGTNDFCVMKYEAKADDNGDGVGDITQTTGYNTWPADTYPISSSRKLVSSAAGYPVAKISQTTAITAAANYTADQSGNTITSAHLITEAEWMTIVQNVLSVVSNWSGGAVGSGYIYSGHNDGAPYSSLAASVDSDGYANTGNSSGNQRRTLTLTNGEVIWDLSGNVNEWTQGTIAANAQPGLSGETGYAWKQWDSSSLLMNGLPITSQPNSTGLSGITWNSSAGVGQLYSNYGETSVSTRAFLRGNRWDNGGDAGVLALALNNSPSFANVYIGLRVSQ